MNRLLIIIITLSLLFNTACNKPGIKEILQAAQWSVDEACSQEWLDSIQCNRITSAIKIALLFSNHGTADEQRLAVRDYFVNEIMELPEDSRLIPYYIWVIDFLNVTAAGKFTPSK